MDQGQALQPATERAAGAAGALDIARLRADTPACERVIFFNNAGASLQPRPVVERVIEHLRLEEQMGSYEAADQVADEHERVYASLAALLRCTPQEIALQDSATRGWQMAFYSLRFRAGDRILTAANEYASNYIAFLQIAQRTGAQVCVVESDHSGAVDLEAMRRMLDDRVKLIALTHVATNSGMVQPAAQVGRLARAAGVPFLLDACQSAGQLPLDVEALGCDMLSAAGRKYLRGPRGTGFLYVRRGWLEQLEPPMLDLHGATWTARDQFTMRDDARRFEIWESSLACRLGLGTAVEYALSLGVEAIAERVRSVAALLRQQLSAVDGVCVRDGGVLQCGIVTFTHGRFSPDELVGRLREHAIAVRTSTCSATRVEMEQRRLDAVLRASVHYYNTEDEVRRFCAALHELR